MKRNSSTQEAVMKDGMPHKWRVKSQNIERNLSSLRMNYIPFFACAPRKGDTIGIEV